MFTICLSTSNTDAIKLYGHIFQRGLYFESGGQPGHEAAWEDAEVNEASNGFFGDTRDTIEHSWLRPRYDGYLEFQNQAGILVRTFLLGEADLSDTLERLEESYQASLKWLL